MPVVKEKSVSVKLLSTDFAKLQAQARRRASKPSLIGGALGSGLASPEKIRVEVATHLSNTNTVWTLLTNSSVSFGNGLLRFDDLDASKYPQRFYRVIEGQ